MCWARGKALGFVVMLGVVGWSSAAAADDAPDPWVGRRVQVNNWKAKIGEKGQVFHTRVELGEILNVSKVDGEWLWVGRGWINKSDVVPYDQAIDFFTAEVARDPKEGYHDRAVARKKRGELDEAIADENEAVRLDPSARRYTTRGGMWMMKVNYDRAIEDFNEAIRLDPKYVLAYNNRGMTWTAKGNYDQAIADFGEAIRLDPKNAAPYQSRGYAWAKKGEYAKALADYDEAIRLDPKYPQTYGYRAWLWATCPEEKLRDGARAVESATRACELTNWKNSRYLDTLAAAYAEKGDFTAAVKWETEALRFKLELGSVTAAQERARLEIYKSGQPYRDVLK